MRPFDREQSPTSAMPATGRTRAGARRGTKARTERTGWRRLLPTWRIALGSALLFLLLLMGAFGAGYVLVDIPAANAAATAQNNVYLYADGSVLARKGETNRQNTALTHIPKGVQEAVLAAENRDFYTESAVDPSAMARAAWNTLTGKGKQSGSTITQQYVKNYYLGQEQTLTRKAKELFIAIKLEQQTSKDDILTGYLNTSYFGRNAYGIQAAAQAYYGTNAESLDTAQGAYLASLLNAPSLYDVVTHPENRPRAVARWNYVLDGMVKQKWLTPAQRAAMTFPEPIPPKAASGLSGQRGYLVEAVNDYLTSHGIIDEKTLAAGGYRITTTFVKERQDALVKAVDDQLTSKADPGKRVQDRTVRAGAVSVDVKSGDVVAMYGGTDYTKQYVNSATRRDYQVGSTFKPLVFTSAVDNDSTTQNGAVITPSTVYDGDNKHMVRGPDGPTGYAPENQDQVSYGPITVTTATDKSVNSVYAQMAQDVGPAKVKHTAVALGVPEDTPDLTASPSIALGVATASVLDMADVYTTLANHGRHQPYTLVEKVTKGGQDLTPPERETTHAVSRVAADTTTQVLRSVVDNGSGEAAALPGREAAGKTGTAEDDKAAWFAGYTPELATVVAVLGQDPDTGAHTPLYGALGQKRMGGGGFPARIWQQYTSGVLKGVPVQDFDLDLRHASAEPSAPAPERDASTPSGQSAPPRTPAEPGTDASGGTDDDPGNGTTGGGGDNGTTGGGTGGDTSGGGTDGGTGGDTSGGGTDGGTGGDTTGGGTDGGTDGGADGGKGSGGAHGGGTNGPGTDDGGWGGPRGPQDWPPQ
ncbi:penicillin-binding protein [Streptomyces spinoverrucosus]|uniref:Penicillin-binding protein n=1 Tax=Streptomyces spinoverrucosus TaxID=284043 RepID=A0A4Y3VVU1_9ACTN|nr:penicillin-binding protein [Streptomyces spinoverrucosus]